MRSLKRNKAGDANKFASFPEAAPKCPITNLQSNVVDKNAYPSLGRTVEECIYNMGTTKSSIIFSTLKSDPPSKIPNAASETTAPLLCSHACCILFFSTEIELRKHKRCHRARNHKCMVEGCDKAFFDPSKLARHQTVHNKKKSYPCPLCSKMFGYKHNIKYHLLLHYGKTPFACSHPGCTRTFAQASNCKVHEKTHLKNKVHLAGIKRKISAHTNPSAPVEKEGDIQTVEAATVTGMVQSGSNRNVSRVRQSAADVASGMLALLSFNEDQLDSVSISDTLLGDDLFSRETLKNSLVCPDSFYAEKDDQDLHNSSLDSHEFELFCQDSAFFP